MKRYRCRYGDGYTTLTEDEIVEWATDKANQILHHRYKAFANEWDDLRQEALMAVLRAMDRYKPTGDVRTYLGRVMAYRIRDEASKIWRYRQRVQALLDELPDECMEYELATQIDKQRYIEQLKQRLNAKERKVIDLNLSGYSDNEIGGMLKIKKADRPKELKAIWRSIASKAKAYRRTND